MRVLFFIFPAFENGSRDAAWQNPLWNQQRWHVLPGAEREISQVGCKHSPHYNSIMYAKLCLYEGGINGWGRCNCLKQGISLSLMSRGSVMGLFTLLWWQGAGVIRNTNPLINFWNGGSFWSKGWIAESAAWNNACVICSLTEFATLIWLYYEVES